MFQNYRGHKIIKRLASSLLCLALIGSNNTSALANDAIYYDDPAQIVDELGEENTEFLEEPYYDLESDSVEPETENPPEGEVVSSWEWSEPNSNLAQYKDEWYLSFPQTQKQELKDNDFEKLKESLPNQITVTYSNNITRDYSLTWDLSNLNISDIEWLYKLQPTVDDLDTDVSTIFDNLYIYLEFDEENSDNKYPGRYPGRYRQLNPDEINDTKHQVKGITPAGSKINLFDYDPKIGSNGDDVLPAGAKFEDYSNGINKDALLLFGGSAMQGAGFWNLGSGAGRPWGQNNVNMKGIVKSTLKDNYPYINLDQARSTLQNPTEPIITEDGPWGNPDRELMDIANLNHAEYVGAGVDKARALSVNLLKSRGLKVEDDGTVSGSCEKASLRYLFDPDTTADGKKSYQNVTGLFQVDEDGYYYYDARKNFAEFEKSKTVDGNGEESDGSFTLYDGPAVWRTDGGWNPDQQEFSGENSLGNFFPFNTNAIRLTG